MPTSPTRTKKALQELAKVFNKLASELTADLNSAINEIDSLKREAQKLKSSSGRTTKTSTFQKKAASSKTGRPHSTNGLKEPLNGLTKCCLPHHHDNEKTANCPRDDCR